jgi:hypothetical protein
MATYSFLMRGDFEERVPNFNRLLDVVSLYGPIRHTDMEYANAYFIAVVDIDEGDWAGGEFPKAMFESFERDFFKVPEGATFEGEYIVRLYDGLSADPVLTLKGVPFPYN